MAAPWNPPTKNQDFEFNICLEDYNVPGRFKSNPTLAAGDVKVSVDNASFSNITTLPTVTPSSSKLVEVALSSTEMNGDKITVLFSDQTEPPEWADYSVTIITST